MQRCCIGCTRFPRRIRRYGTWTALRAHTTRHDDALNVPDMSVSVLSGLTLDIDICTYMCVYVSFSAWMIMV